MTGSTALRLAFVPIVLAGLLACDQTTFESGAPPGGTGTGQGGWCAVKATIGSKCLSCHSAASKLGGLDLETNAYDTLLNGQSQYPGETFVVPGDPSSSFLITKLEGNQKTSEGSPMPLGTPLPQSSIDEVSQWITDGATQDCTGGGTTDTAVAQCDDKNESCSTVGQKKCAGEGPQMLPGADCTTCHHVKIGDLKGPITAAGTAFTDLGGSAPLVGAKIHITDPSGGGNDIVLTTNAAGNFYTTDPIPSPFAAKLVYQNNTIEMVEHQTEGGCNSCHSCSGAAGGKLHGP